MSIHPDDMLAAEMIALLREIKNQQEQTGQRIEAQGRALISLNDAVAALEDRRMAALTTALIWLALATLAAGLLVALALLVVAWSLAEGAPVDPLVTLLWHA